MPLVKLDPLSAHSIMHIFLMLTSLAFQYATGSSLSTHLCPLSDAYLDCLSHLLPGQCPGGCHPQDRSQATSAQHPFLTDPQTPPIIKTSWVPN